MARSRRWVGGAAIAALLAVGASCAGSEPAPPRSAAPASSPEMKSAPARDAAPPAVAADPATATEAPGYDLAQVPTWTADDLAFFLHGSMGTEVLPEPVIAAFLAIYPDLFPGGGLASFGLLETPGMPVPGVSRRNVPHLGGLPSYGLNCASCHVAEFRPLGGGRALRVIGTTGHFDAEAFLGAVIVAQLRTAADAAAMGRVLGTVRRIMDPAADERAFAKVLERQRHLVTAMIAVDPHGADAIERGTLHVIPPGELVVGDELAKTTRAYLRLFHNMRVALHVPDELPSTPPPASGPGRNDAFGLLAASLFQSPAEYAPVKYGLVWNTGQRPWVHWDGNTRSALGRNVLASLGLGAPLVKKRGVLDMALVRRHTALTEAIRPPAYPWDVDRAAAARGATIYAAQCASCHDAPETDARLHEVAATGTDPARARSFDPAHAELFNRFFREVRIDGFAAPAEPPIRSTGKYWAPRLDGAWARSPYLHNGSVRTMEELLTPPAARPRSFRRGSNVYDRERLGFTDEGSYVLDTTTPGNSNAGHAYGTTLDAASRRDLIEHLKTK